MSYRYLYILFFSFLFSVSPLQADPPSQYLVPEESFSAQPSTLFRDLVIFNHFNLEAASSRTIGLEIEMGGLSDTAVIQSLIRSLGGEYRGKEGSGTEEAHVIEGSVIGKIKIEPVNLARLMNRCNATHPNNRIVQNCATERLVAWSDRNFSSLEIVTEPLNYSQIDDFGEALDALGLLGAKGTSLLRTVSSQSNIGIDHTSVQLLRNLAANYARNSSFIRKDIAPTLARRRFISPISQRFLAQLDNPNWNPSMVEFFDAYLNGSPQKLTALNLFNALIMNPENAERFVQPSVGKERVPRPVAEFREANTYFSHEGDPTLSSRTLNREVQFALAFVEASENDGSMTFESQIELASRRLGTNQVPAIQVDLRKILAPQYTAPLRVRPVAGSEFVLGNADLFEGMGFSEDPSVAAAEFVARYGIEVDSSETNPVGTRSSNPLAPYATAHDDGAGGIGDGRALNFGESLRGMINAKGIGLTPYVIKGYSTLLRFHIGGVDGKASLDEGLRSYITGEILHSLGIPSERVLGLIDNKNESEVEGVVDPSAIIVRVLPGGGIRNSHLRAWDPVQIRKGLNYLKDLATAKTGRQLTDQTFLVHDAVESGRIAARMQDAYIVHGAMTAGNILANPGIVDLNTVKFLKNPDPEFTPIAQRSKYGNQARRMRDLVEERQKYYAKANPTLKTLNLDTAFEQSFQRELAKLSLRRLGMSSEMIDTLLEKHSPEVMAYSNELWELQMSHLHTNFRALQMEISSSFAENYLNANKLEVSTDTRTRVATQILQSANDAGYPVVASRRPFLQNAVNRLKGRYSRAGVGSVFVLSGMAFNLLKTGVEEASSGTQLDQKNLVTEMKLSASNLMKQALPSTQEIDNVTNGVTSAKVNGQSTAEPLSDLQLFLDKITTVNTVKNISCIEVAKGA